MQNMPFQIPSTPFKIPNTQIPNRPSMGPAQPIPNTNYLSTKWSSTKVNIPDTQISNGPLMGPGLNFLAGAQVSFPTFPKEISPSLKHGCSFSYIHFVHAMTVMMSFKISGAEWRSWMTSIKILELDTFLLLDHHDGLHKLWLMH